MNGSKDALRQLQQGGGVTRLVDRLYFHLLRIPSVCIDSLAPCLKEGAELIQEDSSMPPIPFDGYGHDDLTPLLRIVKAVKPKNVLELGTAYGNTVANICNVSDARVYTVNALPEQISGTITTVTLGSSEIGRVYRKYGFEERVTQIYENTLNFDHRKYFKCPCIDLAIIDACHDTEYVINDFKKVLPVLTDNAVVMFHDTHPRTDIPHLQGSYNACMQLRSQGFDIKHINDTWWGIWQKGRDGLFVKCLKNLRSIVRN